MRRALFFTPLFLLALLGPAPAPPPPPKVTAAGDKPAVVFQILSINKLLSEIREGIKYTCGPMGDKIADQFNAQLETMFGKGGMDGLDTTKPCVAYLTFGATPEETAFIAAIPVPSEDKLVAMFKHSQFTFEPIKPGSSVYKLEIPNENLPMRVRVLEGYAYWGVNVTDAAMTPEVLVSATKMIDANEKATLCITATPSKVPGYLYDMFRKDYGGELERDIKRAERNNQAFAVALITQFRNLCDKGMGHLEKEVGTFRWRLNYDSKTGLLLDESTITPVKGTKFAGDVQGWGTTQNRFAGMADPTSAAWGISKIPVFNDEVRGMLNALLQGGTDHLAEVPEIGQPVVKELIALGKRTVEKGEGDLGVALFGPNKDKSFTVVAAIVAEDPTAVETELKKLVKGIPIKEITDVIKLDVEKVGDVNLHEMAIGGLLPAEVQNIFGKDCVLCLGISKTTMYAGFGPEARTKVKAAIAAKPGPADAFGLHYNPKKIAALVGLIDEAFGKHVTNALGEDDKLIPFWTVNVAGGSELTVKQKSHYLVMMRVAFQMFQNFGN